jgi:hypothetical protein
VRSPTTSRSLIATPQVGYSACAVRDRRIERREAHPCLPSTSRAD